MVLYLELVLSSEEVSKQVWSSRCAPIAFYELWTVGRRGMARTAGLVSGWDVIGSLVRPLSTHTIVPRSWRQTTGPNLDAGQHCQKTVCRGGSVAGVNLVPAEGRRWMLVCCWAEKLSVFISGVFHTQFFYGLGAKCSVYICKYLKKVKGRITIHDTKIPGIQIA
jgi:hypothetical protein